MAEVANNLGISLSSIHAGSKNIHQTAMTKARCLEVLVIIPVMMQKNWQD